MGILDNTSFTKPTLLSWKKMEADAAESGSKELKQEGRVGNRFNQD